MNKVILIGRLVRDPEVRYTQDQKAVAKFTLAVDNMRKKDEEHSADFISCTAFGKSAEFAEKYLRKGTKIALEGRWQTGSYTNKEGAKVYTNDCIVERMEFVESKKDGQADAQTGAQSDDGFMDVPDEIDNDLPFN